MASEPWSFNQPVLLNKTRHNSSVLVWTLVGTTLFATGWAFLAPLPETVAVQGKLQPASTVLNVDAPLPGVVEAVLVREGQLGAADALGVKQEVALRVLHGLSHPLVEERSRLRAGLGHDARGEGERSKAVCDAREMM